MIHCQRARNPKLPVPATILPVVIVTFVHIILSLSLNQMFQKLLPLIFGKRSQITIVHLSGIGDIIIHCQRARNPKLPVPATILPVVIVTLLPLIFGRRSQITIHLPGFGDIIIHCQRAGNPKLPVPATILAAGFGNIFHCQRPRNPKLPVPTTIPVVIATFVHIILCLTLNQTFQKSLPLVFSIRDGRLS
jgi:hypothetical protein